MHSRGQVQKRRGPDGSRSLWGAEGSFAGLTANVPEAVIKMLKQNRKKYNHRVVEL